MSSWSRNIKEIFKLNIRKKFIIINFFIVIVLSTITSLYFFNFEKKTLYKRIVTEVTLFGETLAIPIVNDLIYERLGLVEEGGLLDNYLQGIFSEKKLNFVYIAVLDDNDTVISHTDIKEYGKRFDDELMLKINREKKTIVSLNKDLFFSKSVEVLVPLLISEKKWGTLRFVVSLDNERKEFAFAILKIFFITIILIFLGYFLVLYLSNIFVNPITTLATAMTKTDIEKLDTYLPVKGDDEFAYLTIQFNNLIERIRLANEELQKKNQMLLQSEKLASIGILASGIAHEINNPLGGIFNCIHMLEEQKDCSSNKYLELIKDGLERIENTVKKLLWMARKGEDTKEVVKVEELVDHIIEFVKYNVLKKRINIEKNIENGLEIFINRSDLEQILLNLLINAIHAIEHDGVIKISCRREGEKILLEIEDNGCGIGKENLNKIFDPFFTTKKQGEGTGLGLWITYEIVKNYGGEIRVESEEGKGSKFYITLDEERNT